MYPSIALSETYSISVYSLSYVFAIIIALVVSYFEVRRYKIPLSVFPATAFWTVLSGMIGNKIFFIIFFDWDNFLLNPWQSITSGGGGMYYGAEICGGAGLIIFALIKKLSIGHLVDVGGIVLLLSHGLGRVGCYLTGCCYGKETDSIFGVTFPGMSHTVHPTQLYETVPLLIGFMIFWKMRKSIHIPGTLYIYYVIFYSSIRFIVEFYRGDTYTYGIFHLSPSQHIALVMGIMAVVVLTRLTKVTKRIQ